jgi:hypothetical protein
MVQEASLPAEGDDLEELAPPSTAAPPPSGKTKVPQKMMNMMRAFEQSARGDDSLQKMESSESGISTATTTKASLFHRPTARGVISQMRSLRITGTSATAKQQQEKQKAEHLQDWEKQWYADDEDDSDEEEDAVYSTTGGASVVTPTNASTSTRPGMVGDSGTTIASSSSLSAHLVTPPDLSSARANSVPNLAYSLDVTPNHQHMPSEDLLTIDDPSTKKTDVSMFLPMLRVLGKGSFGKVRFL